MALGKNQSTYILPARSLDDIVAPVSAVSVHAGNGSPALSSAAVPTRGPSARNNASIDSSIRMGVLYGADGLVESPGSLLAAEQAARDLGDLDLVRPAVDLEHLGVAAELLHAELGHVAIAAEELHRFERHLHRGLRRVELARRGLGEGHGLAGLSHLDLAEDEVLEVHARRLHLRQLELDELELADRLAELYPRPRVVEAQLQALLDDAERHGGDPGALH